jgi:uncharacterized protein (TIGR04222 family)
MTLNPFDWPGPDFLLFYAGLLAATVLLIWQWRRQAEGGVTGEEVGLARELSQDPYEIAFLRGGRYEAVNVAVVSLLERGLLEAEAECLRTTAPEAVVTANAPLDRAILSRFASPLKTMNTPAQVVYTDTTTMAEADHIGEILQAKGLLPNEDMRAGRKARLVGGVAVLWAVGLIKILLALSRGHNNVLFLVLLGVLTPVLLVLVSRRFRTTLGDKTYRWVLDLFAHLRDRRNSVGLNATGSELAFLAAVFGLARLPEAFGQVITPLALTPPATGSQAWGGGSCGSSCASFSGGSCGSGSSCGGGGGGGCGGGCGGCGS